MFICLLFLTLLHPGAPLKPKASHEPPPPFLVTDATEIQVTHLAQLPVQLAEGLDQHGLQGVGGATRHQHLLAQPHMSHVLTSLLWQSI